MSNLLQKGENNLIPQELRLILAAALLLLPILFAILVRFVPILQLFGALMLLIVAVIALIWFEKGLYTLIAFLPFEPFLLKIVPEDLALFLRLLPEVLIAALFIKSAFVYFANKNRGLTDEPILPVLFIFFGLSLVSVLLNQVDLLPAIVGIRQLFRFIFVYIAVVLYGLSRKEIMTTVIIVAVLAVFESLLGVLQAIMGPALDTFLATGKELFVGKIRLSQEIFQIRSAGQRIFATMGRYDQLGTFLSLVAAASLGFIYEGKTKYKKFALLTLITILPALFLTYSRASWFGFLLGLIIAAIVIKKDKRVLAGLLLAVVAITGYVMVKEIQVRRLIDDPEVGPAHRLLEAFSYRRLKSEYTGKGRLYFIIETPKALWPQNMVFGVGPGQYGGGAAALTNNTTAYDELNLPYGIEGWQGQIDNNWMSILGETGLLGIVAYLTLFILLIRQALRILKNSRDPLARSIALGFIAASSAFIFQGFLGTYFEIRTLAPYYWLLAGLMVLSDKQNTTNL